MRDLLSNIHLARAISPAAAVVDNTPLVSQIVDRRGYESLVFAILTGSLADADATFAVLLEHGEQSNLSDAAAVPPEQLNGTMALAGFTFADDDKVRKIGYVGEKRYLRLTITPAANSGNAFVAALAILSDPDQSPTPNPPV